MPSVIEAVAAVPLAHTLVPNAVKKRIDAPDGVERGAKSSFQYNKRVPRSAAGSQGSATSCSEGCAIYVAGSRGPEHTHK